MPGLTPSGRAQPPPGPRHRHPRHRLEPAPRRPPMRRQGPRPPQGRLGPPDRRRHRPQGRRPRRDRRRQSQPRRPAPSPPLSRPGQIRSCQRTRHPVRPRYQRCQPRTAGCLPAPGPLSRRGRRHRPGARPSARARCPGWPGSAPRPGNHPGQPPGHPQRQRSGPAIPPAEQHPDASRTLPRRNRSGSPPKHQLLPAILPRPRAGRLHQPIPVPATPALGTGRSGRKPPAASALQRLPRQSPLPSLDGGPPWRARIMADRSGKRHGHPLLRAYVWPGKRTLPRGSRCWDHARHRAHVVPHSRPGRLSSRPPP